MTATDQERADRERAEDIARKLMRSRDLEEDERIIAQAFASIRAEQKERDAKVAEGWLRHDPDRAIRQSTRTLLETIKETSLDIAAAIRGSE